MNIANSVSREVTSVGFSFFSNEEIRKLSVKQITNPLLFDNLDHPTKGGLYDSALGPHDKGTSCGTCSLGHFSCPGHFGHIDLAAPVYNPITFRLMYKLLQSLCFYCHRLRSSRIVVAHYAAKLKLVYAGLITEAAALDDAVSVRGIRAAAAKKKKTKQSKKSKAASDKLIEDEAEEASDDEEEGEEEEEGDAEGDEFDIDAEIGLGPRTEADIIARIDEYVKTCLEGVPTGGLVQKAMLVVEALRKLERQFMLSIPSASCANCRGQSPKFRKDGQEKIFQKPLSAKQRAAMDSRNLKFEKLFPSASEMDATAGGVDASPAQGESEDDEEAEELQRARRVRSVVDAVITDLDLGSKSAGAEKTAVVNRDKFITTLEVEQHLKMLWKHEQTIFDLLYGSTVVGTGTRTSSCAMFFFDVVSVTPTRFRPVSKMNDMMYDHPQNTHLTDILKANLSMQDLRAQEREALAAIGDTTSQIYAERASDFLKRTMDAWIRLQASVNYLMDSSKAPLIAGGKLAPLGIRQLLEKKEGLFRKHMMGKRVNFAARSVISPDPYIDTNEIGIPPVFAVKLTYPEPVTHHNVKELRRAVINGPLKWPGATHVQNEDGTMVNLATFDEAARTAVASSLLTPNIGAGVDASLHPHVNKKVLRHLRNGDFLLLNRQPTLHKPSIMAHTARVLPGEKTIRMHYANCNTYNADFDGDEMNAHFPQNEVARAEAMLIARTDKQYLVPTDGGVLRGLIQDHVDAGVLMCSRDTTFGKEEYMQLVYGCLRPEGMKGFGSVGNGNIEQELVIGDQGRIVTVEPAHLKPKRLWTGKQVITTVLLNLIAGCEPLNLISKAKIPAKAWGPTGPEEQEVLFMDGHLLTGVLDKSQFGASADGLVHAVYEVYGPSYAGKLLSILGRLFTGYLQIAGFSCRMDDLRLTPKGDIKRRQLILNSKPMGKEACLEFVAGKEADGDLALHMKLEGVLRVDEKMAGLDAAMKAKTNKVTSEIISSTIPEQLLKPFPRNNMQMMTVSGAKGSNVNVSQISCLLGQQELEGRRVPTMISGKTLPSFRAFDTAARAGGFITGRFLTGIKPQEYFFHCMAGREGLIDTAVKTSRSGYLQRCLIKPLEGLRVHYDHTVRDSDGSVVQFHYGEDSLDVTKQKTLRKFDFCAMNYRALVQRYDPTRLQNAGIDTEVVDKVRRRERKKSLPKSVLLEKYSPSRVLGAVSEGFADDLESYVSKNARKYLSNKKTVAEGKKHTAWSGEPVSDARFKMLMNLKYMNSLVEPGEAVGLLAAQSIGEPSTQMTLNTFHFAGFGAKNVTLGIPRLREIIMTASASIKTPMMRLPMLPSTSVAQSDALSKNISRLVLSQIMEGVTVQEVLSGKGADLQRHKILTVRLKFWRAEDYKAEHGISTDDLGKVIEKRFIAALDRAISKDLKGKAKKAEESEEIGVGVGTLFEGRSTKPSGGDAEGSGEKSATLDDEEDAGSELEGEDGDAGQSKQTKKRTQQATYDEPDEEDEEIRERAQDHASDSEGEGGEEGSKSTAGTTAVANGVDEDGSSRADRIIRSSRYVAAYDFDTHGRWCEIQMQFPATTKKMLMVALVEKVCQSVVIHEVPGISRSYPLPNEAENDKSVNIGTDGVNLQGMWDFAHMVDVHKIYTNDVAAVLRTYGVEAARAAIMQEIAAVFGVYGINVDARHLALIADYMTFEGGYKPFNRMGMGSNPSPFAQMSFETTTNFLTTATLSGDYDDLESPSARLVLGKVVKGGTGAFEVRQPLSVASPAVRARSAAARQLSGSGASGKSQRVMRDVVVEA